MKEIIFHKTSQGPGITVLYFIIGGQDCLEGKYWEFIKEDIMKQYKINNWKTEIYIMN